VDLYRLTASGQPANEREFESLGLRDWLAESQTWVLVEWPERAPTLAIRCDLTIGFELVSAEKRTVQLQSQSAAGELALK
jgi:tRNA A37 threonylcarbamoyladenosine biosynthesis protein TsaE